MFFLPLMQSICHTSLQELEGTCLSSDIILLVKGIDRCKDELASTSEKNCSTKVLLTNSNLFVQPVSGTLILNRDEGPISTTL